mmetsp:Transcript_87670/g.277151  ORF Transcript_87670/g.277151 Transcript_87670/m.277151 type:complete len:216 (+) Transcript_87670:469-1116(+)
MATALCDSRSRSGRRQRELMSGTVKAWRTACSRSRPARLRNWAGAIRGESLSCPPQPGWPTRSPRRRGSTPSTTACHQALGQARRPPQRRPPHAQVRAGLLLPRRRAPLAQLGLPRAPRRVRAGGPCPTSQATRALQPVLAPGEFLRRVGPHSRDVTEVRTPKVRRRRSGPVPAPGELLRRLGPQSRAMSWPAPPRGPRRSEPLASTPEVWRSQP